MKMKKFISILSVLALLMGLFTSCGRSDEERSKILKIYNWGDYIDEDVLTDFREDHLPQGLKRSRPQIQRRLVDILVHLFQAGHDA